MAEEVSVLKEQVQAAELAKQLQQARMDRDRAVEVEQLKAQLLLGSAERERAEMQQQHQALMDRQKAQQELQVWPACLHTNLAVQQCRLTMMPLAIH